MDVVQTQQYRGMSLTQKELIREYVLFAVIACLIAVAGGLGFWVYSLQNPDTLQRSDSDIIASGKRFVDKFFSLNSATVDHDQFHALSMIVDDEMRAKEFQRLKESDHIRKVMAARMASRLDWSRAKAEIINRYTNGRVDVRYQAFLVRNDRLADPIDIVVYLWPVERSDDIPDGMGVIGYRDIAEHPFEVEP